MELENCSTELKESYRSIYALVKHLDEQKKDLTTINQLFQPDVNQKRLALIQRCNALLFKDHQAIGKKSRDILWRKGYYEFIAFVKKNWHKEDKSKQNEWVEKLRKFLLEGISNYKWIITKLEKLYDLDLQLLVDFSIINDEDCSNNEKLMNGCDNIQKSLEAVGFALDTIHSALLSLGDLHRYYLDFKFDTSKSTSTKINKNLTARYYYQAFQLNPTIGMAQNQLGTLFYGQNYDLDSIYHYLYSLICTVPFDLSETNVCKLFVAHADYLEDLSPNKVEFNLRDFYARFYLIVDIFFFDKNVPDFNSLCHCVLIDLKKILCSKTMNINESSIFKIVCILIFCMSKLKMINSQKVHSLNAFLVAVCSDLIDSCIVNLEQFILSKSKQNDEFKEIYTNSFNKFEAVVRKSREEYKIFYNKGQTNNMIRSHNKIIKLNTDEIDESNCCKSQKTSQEIGGKQTPSELISHSQDIRNDGDIVCAKATKSSSGDSQSKLSNQLSNKSNSNINKRKHTKLRRRRKRIVQSDDDDDDYDDHENSSYDDSDSELDTDFSSNDDDDDDQDDYDNEEDDASDLSSNFESDFSNVDEDNNAAMDDDDDDDDDDNCESAIFKRNDKIEINQKVTGIATETATTTTTTTTFSDNEDMVIEEEHIIYPNDPDSGDFIEHFNNLNIMNDILHFKNENEDENFTGTSRPQSSVDGKHDYNSDGNQQKSPIKLKYKNKYSKIDPNIIIEFTRSEITMRSLKILFDWLRINNEILIGCYYTNPEFIHKIMKLLNYCNIDIFTRKVYFERDFIKTDSVREKLDDLFSIRSSIPLSEDIILKGFDLLKQTQSTLDWETSIRDRITENEENIMRIFKMVDFAFFICKLKKFNYNFCSKTRRFTENMKNKRDKKKSSSRKRDRKSRNNNNHHRHNRKKIDYCGKPNGEVRGRGCGRKGTNYERKRKSSESRNVILNDQDNQVVTSVMPRKGYLRNRNSTISEKIQQQQQHEQQQLPSNSCSSDEDRKKQQDEQKNDVEEKCRLMGRLWLKNEVETLEAKLKQKPIHVVLTPFIVVDAKALTEFTGIVKALVKSKQFIVLIPNAVLGELDQLKKQSDCARNAIRWLEQEFKVGNRHMRAQRDHETKSLLLIKIPKKLDREASVFIQIAKFCNFIVANHSEGAEYEANLVTFLSGDHLNDKKSTNLSFTGILDAIPVRHDQISNFYEKFKKK